MRISNSIRKLEDASIVAGRATARGARVAARKAAMTIVAGVLVPTAIVANAVIGALDAGYDTARDTLPIAINAIKEV